MSRPWYCVFLPWLSECRQPPPDVPDEPPPMGNRGRDCFEATNRHRSENGLKPYESDDCLMRQAQQHAEYMAQKDPRNRGTALSHDGYSQRLQACSYSWGSENVAWASWEMRGAEAAQAWMDSEGHRANMLSTSYRHCGVGVHGYYWCALYG